MNNQAYVHYKVPQINRAASATTVYVGWRLQRGVRIHRVDLTLFPDVATAQTWAWGLALGNTEPTTDALFAEIMREFVARPVASWTTGMITTLGESTIVIPVHHVVDVELCLVLGVNSNLAGNFVASIVTSEISNDAREAALAAGDRR